MKLSHKAKVAVRKAVEKLRRLEQAENAGYADPMTQAMNAEEYVAQAVDTARRRAVSHMRRSDRLLARVLRYGWVDHDNALVALERFAVRHRLIKFNTTADAAGYED